MFYFNSGDITSDDIEIENQSDGLQTISQRREMILSLLNNGVLNDEKDGISNRMKCKILDMLGMGIWENAQDINELHIKKAGNENLKLLKGEEVKVSEIDSHQLHINEHIAFMLGEDFENACKKDDKLEKAYLNHIEQHKKLNKVEE